MSHCLFHLFKQVHACLRFILWPSLGEWPMRNNEHCVWSPALLALRSRQQCFSCSILKSIRACCVWWSPGMLLTISARCEDSITMNLSPRVTALWQGLNQDSSKLSNAQQSLAPTLIKHTWASSSFTGKWIWSRFEVNYAGQWPSRSRFEEPWSKLWDGEVRGDERNYTFFYWTQRKNCTRHNEISVSADQNTVGNWACSFLPLAYNLSPLVTKSGNGY